MNKFLIVLALIVLPQTAFAQDVGANNDTPLQNAPDKIRVPSRLQDNTSASSDQATLVIKSINKESGRILGGVKIVIDSEGEIGEATTPDPPKEPDGELAFKVIPGAYRITASRNGYVTLTEEITIQGENLKLNLELEPLGSTPNPEEEFAQRLQLMQFAQRVNQSNINYPYGNQYNAMSYQNNYGYSNGNNPYSRNNPFGTSYIGYPATQSGYVFSQNQTNTIPLLVNFPALSMISNLRSYDIRIIDPVLGNEVSLSSYNNPSTGNFSGNTYASIGKYSCIKPGQDYILRINYQNNSYTSSQDHQDFNFQSASQGGFTKIDISEQQVMAFVGGNTTTAQPQIQNLPVASYNLPINCPNSYQNINNQNFNNGSTTWGDQIITTASFGNYSVRRSPTQDSTSNGFRYFLVNDSIYNDARPITFVENETASGGLAFVPAQSGNLYSPNYSSNQWYATTYSRNISAELRVCSDYLSSLMKNPNFSKLEAYLQAVAKKNWSDMSLAMYSTKERYGMCLKTKEYLAKGYQNISIAIPAMDAVEPTLSINVNKFSRVNFSPQEYSQAVAGQVLQSFNVK